MVTLAEQEQRKGRAGQPQGPSAHRCEIPVASPSRLFLSFLREAQVDSDPRTLPGPYPPGAWVCPTLCSLKIYLTLRDWEASTGDGPEEVMSRGKATLDHTVSRKLSPKLHSLFFLPFGLMTHIDSVLTPCLALCWVLYTTLYNLIPTGLYEEYGGRYRIKG